MELDPQKILLFNILVDYSDIVNWYLRRYKWKHNDHDYLGETSPPWERQLRAGGHQTGPRCTGHYDLSGNSYINNIFYNHKFWHQIEILVEIHQEPELFILRVGAKDALK